MGAILSLAPTIFIACSSTSALDTSNGGVSSSMSVADASSPPGL
jgi:hypothetical protein